MKTIVLIAAIAACALPRDASAEKIVKDLKAPDGTALKATYTDGQAASSGIDAHLTGVFRSADAKLLPEVRRAVSATQALYRQNVFADMKVTWGTYITNLGHIDAPGCLRCHDDSHKARSGSAIRQDCELCHKVQ